MDDLSFEESELEYKYLKAIIEGGLEPKPENVLIYATSNRKHLVRETWRDKTDHEDDDVHKNDTVQEKLSLSARFGLQIGYFKPSPKEFIHIVETLAARYPELTISQEELRSRANIWFRRVRPESAGEQNRESGSGESVRGSLFGIAGIKRGRIGLSRADMFL